MATTTRSSNRRGFLFTLPSILGAKILPNPDFKSLTLANSFEPKEYSRRDWLKLLVLGSAAAALGGIGYALYNFSTRQKKDTIPPSISSINFELDKRDNEFVLSTQVLVRDNSGIKDVVVEYSYAGYASKNHMKKITDELYLDERLLPFDLENPDEQGKVRVVARDFAGNEAFEEKSFSFRELLTNYDKQSPTLAYKVDFLAYDNADKVNVEFTASDDVKLKESYVLLNGKKLEKLLFDVDVNKLQDMDFEFVALDLAGNKTKESLRFDRNKILEKLFSSYVSSKRYEFGKEQINEMLSMKSIGQLFKNYELRKKLQIVFDYLGKRWDRIENLKLADRLLSEYEDSAKQKLFVELASYLDKKQLDGLSQAQAKALVKYMEAAKVRDYAYNEEALDSLVRVLQNKNGFELVNFKPLVFKSVDGNDFVIKPDKAREVYSLAEFVCYLKNQGVDLARHAELYEAIREKIISNNWQLFDAPFGISYYEKRYNGREIRPDSKEVKDLIALQWEHWKQFTPQFGNANKLRNRSFPWWDSKKLKQLYPDEETRRQALFFMFFLWPGTYSEEKRKRVAGIEGARTAIEQGSKHYKKIVELYPDGTVTGFTKRQYSPRFYYYGWLVDRGSQNNIRSPRLQNTLVQFMDMDWKTLCHIMDKHWDKPDPTPYIFEHVEYDGIDQYLSKHKTFGKDWDLVKFVMGYERWYAGRILQTIEENGDFLIKQTLQYFGFPAAEIVIYPTPPGVGGDEWAVSLPNYIINDLNQKFGANNLIYGRGNLFGLYSCKDGLIKDGVKEIFMNIWGSGGAAKNSLIYLMKNQ